VISHIHSYVRAHHVGLIALFVALAGTSYAAIALPANSVGTKQLRRGAVTLQKIDSDARFALQRGAGLQGPQGPAGPKGDQGAPGSSGSSTVYGTFKNQVADLPDGVDDYGVFDFGSEPIVTLPLPAGSFHIQAKGFANGEAGNVGCVLVAGQNVDGSLATLPGDRTVEPLVMQVLHQFSEPGQAELRCTDYGGSTRGLFWIKVHATQVDAISNPPAP
jgi:hypothetical protein